MGFAISFIEFIHHTAKFLSASEQPLSIASLQPMGNSLAFWRLNPPVTAFVNVEIQKLAYNFNVYTLILPNIIIPSFLSTKPLYCIRSLQVYLSNYRSTLLFMFDLWNDLATNGSNEVAHSEYGSMQMRIVPLDPLMVNLSFQMTNRKYFGIPAMQPLLNPSPIAQLLIHIINFPPATTLQEVELDFVLCMQVAHRGNFLRGQNGWVNLRSQLIDSDALRTLYRAVSF